VQERKPHKKIKKRRKKEKGEERKWEKERNRYKCEVTVHAGATRGEAPLVP